MPLSVTQPTASELALTPIIRLTSARYARSTWSPPGLSYGIDFNKSGHGFISESHFEDYIGFDVADSMGMTVTRMTAGDATTRVQATEQPTR